MAAPSVEFSWLEAVADIIKTVGFPIFVACWLLLRTDRRLDDVIRLLTNRRT